MDHSVYVPRGAGIDTAPTGSGACSGREVHIIQHFPKRDGGAPQRLEAEQSLGLDLSQRESLGDFKFVCSLLQVCGLKSLQVQE